MDNGTNRSGWAALLADLKRRRVFRAAVIYAAAGFAGLQTADFAVQPLRLTRRAG